MPDLLLFGDTERNAALRHEVPIAIAGYPTQRTSPGKEGFQFSLGHGVGLSVHEDPALSQAGHDALVAGDVVAVEPGLWRPDIGGVNFEDLLLVTELGCETITAYPYDLTP